MTKTANAVPSGSDVPARSPRQGLRVTGIGAALWALACFAPLALGGAATAAAFAKEGVGGAVVVGAVALFVGSGRVRGARSPGKDQNG